MTADQYAQIAVLLLFTVVAAILDWSAKRLPNWLTVSMAAAGLVFHLVAGAITGGLPGLGGGLLHSLGGFAVGFGLLFILWAIGAGGGGDVKYTAALGTWLGAGPVFYVIVLSVCLVAVGSVFVMFYQVVSKGYGKTKERYIQQQRPAKGRNTDADRQERMVRRRLMPWAFPTAIATWLVLAYQVYRATQG